MAVLQGSLCKLTNLLSIHKYTCRLSTSVLLEKQSLEEKLGIKPKPKRPLSIFLKYLSKVKPQLSYQHPKATVAEINKLAGEKWKTEDEKLKKSLQEEYRSEWMNYVERMRAYEMGLSPGVKEQIKQASDESTKLRKIRRQKKETNQKKEELGRPKKPPSAFVFFMQTKLNTRGETPYIDWLRTMKDEWSKADESIKTPLVERYQKELARYKSELEKWESRMKSDGHEDLVRRKHRK